MELAELLKTLRLTSDNLEQYHEDERKYLNELTEETAEDETSVSAKYVELLEKLASAK